MNKLLTLLLEEHLDWYLALGL